MNVGAIRHESLLLFRQPLARNAIRFRLLTACGDMEQCSIVYWKRSEPAQRLTMPMHIRAQDQQTAEWIAEIAFPEEMHYIKYFFQLTDLDGNAAYYSEHGFSRGEPTAGYFELLQVNDTDVIAPPSWARGTVFYQIFPERFAKGSAAAKSHPLEAWDAQPTRDNFLGGDLQVILQNLHYLQKLGIDALYLTPIFDGDFNHKYATTDYFRIDPDFGTEDDLKSLVTEAHEYGIHVLLDGVFNHCGIHFAPFADLLEKGESSAYRNWFYPKRFPLAVDAACYECVGDYPYMPRLNTSNPEVQHYILSVMRYWVQQAGIDGWRLDVADELDVGCLQYLRRQLRREYPDVLLLGETWGDAGRMLNGNDQCDTVMNYLFRDAMVDYFACSAIDEEELDHRLERMRMKYPEETVHCLYHCLSSHDTPRFLTLSGGEKWRLKLAVAFQMLFPGSPAVYYGEEIGMQGENDPGCRAGMNWSHPDEELLNWTTEMVQLRRQHEAIRTGSYRVLCKDKSKKLFAFERASETESTIAVFNSGDTSQDFTAAAETVTVPAHAVKIIQ